MHKGKAALCICAFGILAAGCGGDSNAPPASTQSTCTGISISGVLQDASTHQPVSQGWAVLEFGNLYSPIPSHEVNFAPAQRVAADATGTFHICTPTLFAPSAVVVEALDTAGNSYAPFVASVSSSTNFGTIPMGVSGLGTTAPAILSGHILSTPIALSGTVTAQYPISALDGSKSSDGVPLLWSLAMPSLSPSTTSTFSSITGGCSGVAQLCGTYSFTLPSQNVVQPTDSGYLQLAGTPVYLIYAVPAPPATCLPPYGFAVVQQDGVSVLEAKPGAQLTASDVAFLSCR